MSTPRPKRIMKLQRPFSLPNKRTAAVILTAALLTLFLSACGFPAWRDQALCEVAEGRWHVGP